MRRTSLLFVMLTFSACSTTPTAVPTLTPSAPIVGAGLPTGALGTQVLPTNTPRACGPWTFDAPPTPAGSSPASFDDIAARKPTDVWAVGSPGGGGSFVDHFNGSKWALVKTWSAQTLSAIALDTRDVWAAGSRNSSGVIARYDGKKWTQATIASPRGATETRLIGIAVPVAGVVWAVGSYDGSGGAGDTKTVLVQRSGTMWKTMPGAGARASLEDADGVSARDGWAVGRTELGLENAPSAYAAHWDGTTWRATKVPSGPDVELHAVTQIAANDVWASGTKSDGHGSHSLLLHWNGSRWSIVTHPQIGVSGTRPNAPPYGPVLSGMDARAADDVWAAGTSLKESDTELFDQTLVLHYDGTAWEAVKTPNAKVSSSLVAVAATGARALAAAGTRVDDSQDAPAALRGGCA